MEKIDAKMVKELRERTGTGMMDCKKALVNSNGNMEKAIEFLRERSLATASQKAKRTASEGLVYACVEPTKKVGVLIEVNCETDFVAKNSVFEKFVQDVAQLVINEDPIDLKELLSSNFSGNTTVTEAVTSMINSFGENIAVRRFERYQALENEAVDSYIHNDFLTNGKIGVLIQCSTMKKETQNQPEFITFMMHLAMQIAASKPDYVCRDDIPAEIVKREKSIYQVQALNEGKPLSVAEKIIQGRLEKFYKDICLLEQNYIKEPEKLIKELVMGMNNKFDDVITIVKFTRFEKGKASAEI